MKQYPLYLAIYLPEWSVEVAARSLREGDSDSLILTRESYGISRVYRASCSLREQGIRAGIPVEMAHSLSSHLIERPFEPEKDFEKILILAQSAVRYAPIVGIDRELMSAHRNGALATLSPEHTGIILNITGTERLYGKNSPNNPHEGLATHLIHHLQKRQITAHIGIAATIGAAWALSRFQPITLSSRQLASTQQSIPAHTYSSLQKLSSHLPIEALRLPPSSSKALRELGLTTIQRLTQTPRKDLGARFGISLLRAIDEFFGAIPEPLISVHNPLSVITEREFDPPILKRSEIVQGLELVFKELLASAKKQHASGARFILTLIGSDVNYSPFIIHRTLSLHAATSEVRVIHQILTPIIEGMNFPGSVHTIRLHLQDADAATPHQETISSPLSISPRHSKYLLNKLAGTSMNSHLCILESHESYLPEKRFSYRVIRPNEIPASSSHPHRSLTEAEGFGAFYPSHIFSQPEEVFVLSSHPEGFPATMKWRQTTYKSSAVIGPEKVSPEWWHEALDKISLHQEERDYFILLSDSGEWFWIYQATASYKWYLQGVWG